MTLYPGPWIQGDDYEAPTGLIGTAYSYEVTHLYAGSPPPYNGVMNDALDALPAGLATASPDAGLSLGLGIDFVSYEAVPAELHEIRAAGTLEAVGERDATSLWTGGYSPGVWPPGAATYEYEDDHATPVGALLHIVADVTATDNTNEATGVSTSANAVVTIKAFGTSGFVTLDSFGVSHGTSVDNEYDLTPFMDPVDGHVLVRDEIAKGEWSYVDPYFTDEPGLETGDGLISLAFGVVVSPENPVLTYTLRPPRHRFLYLEPQMFASPPCRLYPRDDNLGNTPRLFPPPTTRQRSPRVGGYY